MSLYSFVDNCTFVNTTKQADNRPIHLFLTILSPAALVISCLALTVLSRQQAIRLGSMRVNLITLTIFEALLNLLIFMVMLRHLLTDQDKPSHLYKTMFDLSTFVFIGGALCSRNWIITLIAMARCIAVTKPMVSRSIYSHLFRPKWVGFCTISCIAIGFILSALRLFELHIEICTTRNYETKLRPNKEWRIVKDFFFTYQSALPISIVTLVTIIMIITLIRHRPPPHSRHSGYRETIHEDTRKVEQINNTKTSTTAGNAATAENECVEIRQKSTISDHRKSTRRTQNQVRATRMITLLAATFTLFEAPIFFCVILESYFEPTKYNLVTNALKSLVVLDSCANVVIYLAMSKRFRQESRHLWRYALGRKTKRNTTQTYVIS